MKIIVLPSSSIIKGSKIVRWIKHNHWFILIGLAIFAFFLGYVGFSQSYERADLGASPFDLIYLSIQLFVLQSGTIVPVAGWELQVARFLAPAITFSSLLLFLLILFHERIMRFRLRFARNHVIICSRSRIGASLSKNFDAAGNRVVLIDSAVDIVKTHATPLYRGLYLYDDPTILKVHSNISTRYAQYLFAVEDDDGLNLEISALIPEIMKDSRLNPLFCFIHLNSPEVTNLFREQQLSAVSNKRYRIEYFNIYQLAGWTLLHDFSPFPGESFEVTPIHVMILGIGGMGESTIVQLVKKWRNIQKDPTQKITITVIDKVAKRKISRIVIKYPSLTDYVNILPYEMDIESSDFLDGQFMKIPKEIPPLSMIYCCFEDQTLNLLAAFELQKLISHHTIRNENNIEIPIIVRTSSEMGFHRIIQEKSGIMDKYRNIHSFPFIDRTCSPEIIHYSDFEVVARAIHEDYITQQLKSGRMMDSDNTDPESPMKPWEKLSESLKASNRGQAADIRNKLTLVGCEIFPSTQWDEPLFEFTREELEMLAIHEHTRWMEEKIQSGWTYGPIRNNEKKIHNCLVPWEELPDNEKEKDRDAVRAIPLLLQKVDLSIRRV